MTTLHATRFAGHVNQPQFGKFNLPQISFPKKYVDFGFRRWEETEFQVMTFNHLFEDIVNSTLRRPLNYFRQLSLKLKQPAMSLTEVLNHEYALWKRLFKRKP